MLAHLSDYTSEIIRTITSSALGPRSAPFCGGSTLPFALFALFFRMMVSSRGTTDFLRAMVGSSRGCECLVGRRCGWSVSFM